MKRFWLAGLLMWSLAGCGGDLDSEPAIDGQRAPLAGPMQNTLNSPTEGPTSAGLSGGTAGSEPPDLDPSRGRPLP